MVATRHWGKSIVAMVASVEIENCEEFACCVLASDHAGLVRTGRLRPQFGRHTRDPSKAEWRKQGGAKASYLLDLLRSQMPKHPGCSAPEGHELDPYEIWSEVDSEEEAKAFPRSEYGASIPLCWPPLSSLVQPLAYLPAFAFAPIVMPSDLRRRASWTTHPRSGNTWMTMRRS